MAEKKVQIDIIIETANAANSLRDIKTALRDVNSEILKTEEGTEEFNKLTNAAGKLKDRINDLNDTLKLQQGSGLERFKNSIGTIREGILNLDFDKFKLGINGATQAFGGLSGAIAATGIGALVLGVTALIANFDVLREKFSGLDKVAKGFEIVIGKIVDFIVDAVKFAGDLYTEFETVFNILFPITNLIDLVIEKLGEEADAQAEVERQNAEAERKNKERFDAESQRREKKQKAYQDEIEILKSLGKDTSALELQALKADKALLDNQVQRLKNFIGISTFFDNVLIPKLKELEEQQKDAALAVQVKENEINTKRTADAEKTAEERIKFDQKYNESALEALIRQEAEEIDLAKKLNRSEETILNIKKSFFDKRLKLAGDKGEELKSKEVNLATQTQEAIGLTITQTESEIVMGTLSIGDKLEALVEKIGTVLEKYGERVIGIYSSISQGIIDNQQTEIDIEETKLNAQFERRRAFIEANVQDEKERARQLGLLDSEIENSRNQIERKRIELEKKAIKRERNLAIASIALNTGIAIAGAVKVASTSSFDPISFAINIAANIAAVVAAIAKANQGIKQADASIAALGAGGGGGTASISSSSIQSTAQAQTPNSFALFGTGGSGNNVSGNQPQLIQAFVSESDISSVQRRLNRFRTASEL
jgi:hypothetical protein